MSSIFDRKRYIILNRIARQKGMTLHRTISGYLIRKNGRIVKQSFALGEMQTYLLNEED